MAVRKTSSKNGIAGGVKAAKSLKKRTGAAAKAAHSSKPKKVQVISSKLSYDGPLFRVFTDVIRENGTVSRRDVIRHDGSAVILAIDDRRSKKDPLIVMERQYRHAAKQYLLEVPAGKLEEGENPLQGAKRELLEETGFQARRWRKLAHYFASPGFLGEWMQVFLAEGLTPGASRPDDDEQIQIEMIPVSEVLRRIEHGKIQDGKTLISVMLYDRQRRQTQATRSRKK